MKKYALILTSILLSILLAGCALHKAPPGIIDGAKIDIGSSEIYSREDIESAMQTVMDYFEEHFRRCTLLELAYNEYLNIEQGNGSRAASCNADEDIILFSSFYVDAIELKDGLNTDYTYENWLWILSRSDGEAWTLRDWGY